jgi:uncharacterized protein
MRLVDHTLVAAPTDLANFLVCRHKTALDKLVAEGRLARPEWTDPLADVLRKRGEEHEQRYVDALRSQGLTVVDLSSVSRDDRHTNREQTLDAMRSGADVIVQAALGNDDWFGYADVLRKVPIASPSLGDWSYQAHDAKLTRETRGGTILQLCVYTDLLGDIQGRVPDSFAVVTPAGVETYRFNDFAAYYRRIKTELLAALRTQHVAPRTEHPAPRTEHPAHGNAPIAPDPVDHCQVCRWWPRCNAERRAGDHLGFVAGIGREQRAELVSRGVTTLAALAGIPVPLEFKPKRGAADTYVRLREQARLQKARRDTGELALEILPVEKDFGLTQLPEPRPGDFFLDLEGDPFGRPSAGTDAGEGGREYLFGLGRLDADGRWSYVARWAFTDADEHTAFDWAMAEIMSGLEADPAIHVYHYAAYEPTAFKRLMGRYAAREADLDRLLRGRRFVDLYAVVRHALRAGVESYSIKDLEPFFGFTRDVALDAAGDHRRLVELALETGDTSTVTSDIRTTVEGYNRDDCRSALELRGWLEKLRANQIAAGAEITRPPLEPDAPSEEVSQRQQRVNVLRARLLDGVPPTATDRTPHQYARYLLAYMIDWHYREDKVTWWEYYRLLGMSDEDLGDERKAVTGLEFVERVNLVRHAKTGRLTGSVVDRYRYPLQECDLDDDDALTMRDEEAFGTVVWIDRAHRLVDIKKGPSKAELHPSSAFVHQRFDPKQMAGSLYRLGERVAEGGLEAASPAARELLLRRTSRRVDQGPGALAIQGPPGSGKTYTGARMIAELVAKGKRVGVTATSHKVIGNMLKEVAEASSAVRLGHLGKQPLDLPGVTIQEFTNNGEALDAVFHGRIDVLGATAFFWGREDCAGAVDVLFIDEAGQMSLANALAVSQAAANLVLLGDPQQLEQPQKGSHPDGVGVSALEHVLDGLPTIPMDRGIFLPETYRLAPKICEFTSEVFYEGRLSPVAGLDRQRLVGAGRFDGAGLFYVEATHDGCRNSSDVEVDLVAHIVKDLLAPGVRWVDKGGAERPMTMGDIRVVAPYNAQVTRLQESLPSGVPVGTVDKFQGQEAPVVIYSMATSRPEDAPRGMEFLYNLNRLNVATSRARCACILVASPRLFEPECRTPRQMRLANGLGRYAEGAR